MLVVIHEFAEAEINEAKLYYNLQSPGLGNLFLAEVEKSLSQIANFPKATPLVRDNIRKKILPCFPYSLLYSIQTNQIRILAVAHHKRRPFYWRDRT